MLRCHYIDDYSAFEYTQSVSDVVLHFSLTLFSHGFSKHSREQYEKLSTMHKNMQKLYENIGSFLAFDPHSVSVEDFFGQLANFRLLFLVSICFMVCAYGHTLYGTVQIRLCRFLQSRHMQTDRSHHPHIHIMLHTLSLAHTYWMSVNRMCVLNMHASDFQWVLTDGENITVLLLWMELICIQITNLREYKTDS